MSAAIQLLKVYFQINLLLAITFVIFRLTKSRYLKASELAGHLVLLRLAQGVVLLSLMTPLALNFVPTHHLPSAKFSPTRMLTEPSSVGQVKKASSAILSQESLPVTQFAQKSRYDLRWFQTQVSKDFGLKVLALLIGLGISISSLRLWRKSNELRKLIADSISIREVGKVSVRVSEQTQVPFSVLMNGRANVIVPSDLVHRTADFKIAVRHELQHHRQSDTFWAMVIEWLVCIFFVNPIIYLWKKEIIEFQEFSCDEALIGRKRISSYEYGVCLLRVAESAMESRAMFVGTAGMASNSKNPVYFKSFLRRRIEMFDVYRFHNGRSKGQKRVGIALGTVTAFVTVAFAYGSERSFRQSTLDPVNPGAAIFDSKIQSIAEKVLSSALEKSDSLAGFVLVSDSNTGRLLAVANQIRDKSLSRPQKSWALSYPMAAGSVTKPILAAAAIERGVTKIDQSHNCEKGNYEVGGKVYHDHAQFDHLTTAQTIAQSSDICSVKIGEKLGATELDKALKNFGFGPGGTTQNFPEAISGRYPSPSEVPFFEYVHMISVGGAESDIPEPLRFYTTPLEVLYAYGAIANGGNLMKPLLSTASASEAKVVRRVLSEENAKQIKDALALTVSEGTGSNARSEIYSTAGKTSTGHFHLSDAEKHKKLGMKSDFGGFAGFAPAGKPRIAVYAVVISPKKENVIGNTHAAPVFRQVTDEVLQYLNVASDKK
jgi:beta-lactamase regulating signal transducer with metallopeptidase domain